MCHCTLLDKFKISILKNTTCTSICKELKIEQLREVRRSNTGILPHEESQDNITIQFNLEQDRKITIKSEGSLALRTMHTSQFHCSWASFHREAHRKKNLEIWTSHVWKYSLRKVRNHKSKKPTNHKTKPTKQTPPQNTGEVSNPATGRVARRAGQWPNRSFLF